MTGFSGSILSVKLRVMPRASVNRVAEQDRNCCGGDQGPKRLFGLFCVCEGEEAIIGLFHPLAIMGSGAYRWWQRGKLFIRIALVFLGGC